MRCKSNAFLMLCACMALNGMDGEQPRLRRTPSFHRRHQSAGDATSMVGPETTRRMQAAIGAAAGVVISSAVDAGEQSPKSDPDAQSTTPQVDRSASLLEEIASVGAQPHSGRSSLGSSGFMSDDSDDEDDNGSGGEGVQLPQAVNENPPDDTSADDPAPIRHAQQSLLLQSVFKRGIPISKLFKWGLGVYIVYKIVNALFEKDDEDLDEDDEE